MNRPHAHRLPLHIAMLFSLCLCNLVLREFVVYLEHCRVCSDPQHLAEHGGVADFTHLHDHEDDFVPVVPAAPQTRIGLAGAIGTGNLPACSRVVSPLLPPPKTA